MNNAAILPAPASDDSLLPQKYEAARTAIAECERIDECKDWKDKAAAIRVYAMQVKDDSLKVMAIRIQARAERRMGDLLAQYPDGQQTGLLQHREAGTHPTVTRVQAATNAGLSDHQRKTALRVAAVPDAAFETQVESPYPPSITHLAQQGRIVRVIAPDPSADHFKAACAVLHQFATFCDMHDAVETAKSFGADDVEMARRCVSTLDQWLDRFVINLG